MSILYKKLGGDLRLSDIVFAGSHDASITSGSSYAKTQSYSIAQQLLFGVRIFDLRILASMQNGSVKLVGYHGKAKNKSKGFFKSNVTDKSYRVDYAGGIGGEFGLRLKPILEQAREFVEATSEFCILKFDKCTNWQMIADYCVEILGDSIYTASPGQELSKRTLNELAGKVICVFNDKNVQQNIRGLDSTDGILGFKSLKGDGDVKPYTAGYPGLQYYGKGGTRWYAFWKTNAGKMNENKKKQVKLMAKMTNHSEQQFTNALGMIYWTSTGSVSNIKTRNNRMWKDASVQKMRRMWESVLEDGVGAQLLSDEAKYMQYGSGARMKSFFPNIVMIDFADHTKCEEIYALNEIASDRLGKAFDEYIIMHEE